LELPIIINRTAAAIAAAAIYEIFPGSELFGGGETDTGFFYQFFYAHPMPPEAPKLLEERMRQIIREERPLREAEMVACSAKELFLKADHPAAVDALSELEPKELVSVIQIGTFSDLAEGPFCSSLREVGAFRITALKFLGDGEIRIEGSAFSTKEELKNFLRRLAKYSEENHLVRGEALKFWQLQDGQLLWLPRGLKLRENLLALLKKSFCGVELRAASEKAVNAYCCKRAPFTALTFQEKFKNPEEGKGLFEEECQSVFQQTIYCSAKEFKDFSISLLQTIDKTLIILGFRASSGPTGPKRNEWTVEDGLGRAQTVFQWSLLEEDGCKLLRMKVGVEKILALLLEQAVVDLKCIEN
jgi:hypothetical protein